MGWTVRPHSSSVMPVSLFQLGFRGLVFRVQGHNPQINEPHSPNLSLPGAVQLNFAISGIRFPGYSLLSILWMYP